MKKIMPILLASVLLFHFTACGVKNTAPEDEAAKIEITDATELLTKAWKMVPEDKQFYVVGGDAEHIVEEKPGSFHLENAEELGLENTMCYPMSAVEYIDDAATLIHGMISNGFTAGAYHVTKEADMQMVTEAIRNRTLENQWLCGFPEKLMIATVEDYVVSVFGYTDNVDAFDEALKSVYGDAVVVVADERIE